MLSSLDRSIVAKIVVVLSLASALGCDTPSTNVVLDNDYRAGSALVVYHAFWQAVPFETPVVPGSSSDAQPTVAASGDTAYVLLAPGWDPLGSTPPNSLVVMESRGPYGVNFNDTVHIPVNDLTFIGNCAVGSTLKQAEADFIAHQIFAADFAGFTYDAATCTMTAIGDAGAD